MAELEGFHQDLWKVRWFPTSSSSDSFIAPPLLPTIFSQEAIHLTQVQQFFSQAFDPCFAEQASKYKQKFAVTLFLVDTRKKK